MGIITVYALYGDDIKYLETRSDLDQIFNITTMLVILFFTIELIISSIVIDDYLNSFYFWLDLLSTLSLILDLDWIWNSIVGNTNVNGTTSKNL